MSKNTLSRRACLSQLLKKDDLVEHLQCAACDKLLYNAFQTSHGCRLCGPCIENHLGKLDPKSSCICPGKTDACCKPIDGEPLPKISMKHPDFAITPDNATRNEVNRLKATCPNSDCGEAMPLKQIDKHLGDCLYQNVVCEKCGCGLIRKLLDEHREKFCSERPVTCEYCNRELSYREMQSGHLDLKMDTCCSQYRTACPFCSEVGPFSRAELENEHKFSCIGYPRNCSFQRLNCSFYDSKEKIENHEKSLDGMHLHMKLFEKFLFDNKDDCEDVNEKTRPSGYGRNFARTAVAFVNESGQFSNEGDENLSSREEVDEVRNQIAKMQTIYTQLQKEFQDSTKTLARSQKTLASLFEKFKRLQLQSAIRFENVLKIESMAEALGGINNISKTMLSIKESVSRHDDLIRNLQSNRPTADRTSDTHTISSSAGAEQSKKNQLETPSYNGRLIWKIDNYFRRKQEAARREKLSFYSPAFYTSRYGYKMCARIYLNGDGTAENDAISLFFVLMKGEYDDLLAWPFTCKVTLTAINLKHPNKSKVDTFKPDTSSNSFMQPTSDMNIASGCPRFATHSELEGGDFITKDNSLYIKVVVDTSDLRDPSET